jgi:hypothetical protein
MSLIYSAKTNHYNSHISPPLPQAYQRRGGRRNWAGGGFLQLLQNELCDYKYEYQCEIEMIVRRKEHEST